MTAGPEGLLRGRGPALGAFAQRYPIAQRTLLHVLSDRAQELGDQDWLVFDGTVRLGYRSAYKRVNQVGHAVIRDVGASANVCLMLRNQSEFMPAFLGTMAAKGVTVPLNADARGPLLEYVIRKCNARVLIVRADLMVRLAELEGLGAVELVVSVGPCSDAQNDDSAEQGSLHGVPVVRWEEWLMDLPTSAPFDDHESADVALIQFTSGTTGPSKGVVYPHHFLYLYSAMIADRMKHGPEDVLFSSMPLYHVAALHLIANAALHAGCVAHLRSRFSASGFWDEIADAGATHTVLLGPMAQIILKTNPGAPPHKMRVIYCAPYPPGGDEFQSRFGVKLVWQGFGMTEIYTHPYFDHPQEGVTTDTAGHPVAWMDYGVVDSRDRMLPSGETGELVFRPLLPDAMAREYYEEPAATVAAFRNFMFHTGDLAYLDPEGQVHFVGRKQDRIRRMGENVSAAELEGVALAHPDVLEAAAYGVLGQFGEHDIKLDVVCGPQAPTAAALHAWLSEQLPRYMVPRFLEFRDSFPKTPSERIEKYRIKQEGVERPTVHTFETPRRSE